MQLQLLLNKSLNRNQLYKQLISQLNQKQQNCLKTCRNEQQKQKCQQKGRQFAQYMAQYRIQFKQKGRVMCHEMMKQYNDIDSKIMVKDQCISFYARSISIFQENAIDKLKSLVRNIDFSEL